MEADKTISHASYTGSQSTDGYPTADQFGTAVDRPVYGWYPLSSQLDTTGEYVRRVTQSTVVLVPDASPYSPRDKVLLPGDANGWFVTDVNDYTTGPFGYQPGGTITVEQVTG